jgi:hypothetical protein
MKDRYVALLAVGGTLWGLGLWLATGVQPERLSSHCCDHGSGDRQQEELILERSFELSPGGQLEMDVADADVQVTPGTGPATVKVYVMARDVDWGRELVDRMDFNISADGNMLIVEADQPNVARHEWREHRGGAGVEVRVSVPARFDADIRTGDGDVSLGDLEGRISVHTGDGDLSIGALSGPEIKLRTSDGDVSAAGLEAARIELHSSDGDVRVRRVAGALEASTGDGDISVWLAAAQEAQLLSGDGDITVYATPTLGFDLELSGETVSLSAGFQLDGTRGPGWVRGRVNGGGAPLRIRTSDGTVRFRLEG